MIEAALLVGAYLAGAIPFGVLMARSRGIDLFQVGSGNVGATNVNRALGKGPALVVFGLDVAKGFAPSLAARLLLDSPEWGLIVGAAAIAGHCLSPFLRFRGGKGIATGLGALLGSTPAVALGAFGVFLFALWVCRWVSFSSILAVASTLIWGVVFGDSPFMLSMYGVLFLFVVYRHRANLRRLRSGEEPKFRWNRGKNEDSGPDESNTKEMAATFPPSAPQSGLRWDGGPYA